MDVGSTLANPWFPYLVLGAGLLLTIVTAIVPLRGLPAALREWTRPSRSAHLGFLAASAGVAAMAGGILAVDAGGPGALVWMWIGTLLGMSLVHVEATLARRRDPAVPAGAPLVARAPGAIGRAIAILVSLALLAFAIATAMLQTQQTAHVARALGGTLPWWVTALLVAAVAWICTRVARVRAFVFGVAVPVALLVFVLLASWLALRDPSALAATLREAIDAAFGLRAFALGSAGATLGVALHHGVLRAITAGNIGLGCAAALAHDAPDTAPAATGAGAMLVPVLTAGLMATAGACVVLGAPPPAPVAQPKPLPMQRVMNRELRPSFDVGQTIVLPTDTTMEVDKHYRMLLRADARGHQVAKLFKEDNKVVVPRWQVSEDVDTVVFRSRDRAAQAGWDVRIPCERTTLGEGPRQLVTLTPKDPELEFGKVIAFYELDPRPYVELDDFSFIGQVAEATTADLGPHLAMFEAKDKDRPFNPLLHEFFRLGYLGPFVPSEDQPRAPLGFVAAEDFDAPVGEILRLKLSSPARGVDIVRVNRIGAAESPPWSFLTGVDRLVLRHAKDPARDIVVPVRAEAKGYRIRYEVLDPAWQDFRPVRTMEDYSGPYAIVPPFEFAAEVHSDIRLPPTLAGRRTLVPLDVPPAVTGPSEENPRPHPSELIAAGMEGPFLADGGLTPMASRVANEGSAGGLVLFLALLVLASAATAAWALASARSVQFWLGERVGAVVSTVVVLAACAGGALSSTNLLAWLDVAVIAVAVPNLAALLLLPRRHRDETTTGSTA